jgi:hypothetical protein
MTRQAMNYVRASRASRLHPAAERTGAAAQVVGGSVLSWTVLALLALAVGIVWWRARGEHARQAIAWDALARALSLGFDAGSRSIRGKYRLLRLEITAGRQLLGLGPWRTRIAAGYEGVIPAGLTLAADPQRLRASADQAVPLETWLDAHRRRELLSGLLAGGVHVSGHTVRVETPGLLTDPEALRTLLGQLAELAKLLSLR